MNSRTTSKVTMKSNRSAIRAGALCIAVAMLSLPALAIIRKPPATPPSTPGNFHVTATTTSSVTFAWNASTNGTGGSLGYDIVNDTTGFSLNVGNITSYTWTIGVEAGGTYSFHIYAYSGYTQVSANSPEITATLQGTPLPVPVKPAAPVITQTSVTSNTINVVWSESTPANEISGYTVAVNGILEGSSNASTLTALATGLVPSYTYTVTVTAYSLSGVTGDLTTASAPVSVTTAAATTSPAPASVLTAPSGLNGGGDGGGEAIISWNPSISANEPQQDIQYNIYVSGVLDSFDGTVGQTTDVYIFPRGATDPAPCFVVAVDNLGNVSAPSNVIELTSF
jgi:chitinase